MAPVPLGSRDRGVPGELDPLPGPVHSYRLRAGFCAETVSDPASETGESSPSRTAHSVHRISCLASASSPHIYGRFPNTSFSSEQMKRGLYV
jgi:hypothetical protein